MASRIKGLTIEIGGNTTKLQAALKGVNTQIRSTTTSLRDVDRLLKFNPGNTELLRQKQQLLAKSIQDTNEKLKTLKETQRQMDAAGVDKNSDEYQRLRREIIETENKLKSLNMEFKNFGSVASQAIIAAGEKMQQVGQQIKAVGDSIASVGSKMTRTVTAPILGIGTAAVKTAADYEAAMSEVRAITGASDDDFQQLSDTAREWGTNSVFSASEVADAYKYMGMAGWDATQMLEGLPGVLNLAAASGEDLGTVSDIVTDGLTAFGYGAKDAAHFADVLAAAATSSNTNVSMMGESFKYAAPVAGALGYSVDDVAVALGLMANSGIKASQAGTTLRTVLQNMTNPTDSMAAAMDALGVSLDDGNGNMYSFMEIMEQLRAGFGQLKIPQEEFLSQMEQLDAAFDDGTMSEKEYTDAQAALMERAYGAEGALKAQNAAMLGGARSMSGLLAIVNASDEDFASLTESIRGSSGAAERMADTMQDNLAGELKKLKNNLKELGISFGNVMLPAIKKVVGGIQDLIKKLQNLTPKQREQVVKIAAIAAAIGPALLAVGKLTSAFGTLVTGAGKVVTGLGKLSSILMANPYAAAAIGAVALAAGIAKIVDAMTETPYEAFTAKLETVKAEMASVNEMTQQYQQLEQTRQANVAAVQAETAHSAALKTELDTLLGADRDLTDAERERANFIITSLFDSLGVEYNRNNDLIQQYQDMAGEIDTLMEKQRQKAFLVANEDMYYEAIKREGEAHTEAQTAYNAYMDAVAAAQPVFDAFTAAENELADAAERAGDTVYSFGGSPVEQAQQNLDSARIAMENAQAELDALSQQFVDAQSAADGYTATIANYEAASAAVISGSQNAEAAIQQLNQGFITAETGTATSLANQVIAANQAYEELVAAVENGYLAADDAAVQGALALVEASIAEFDKLPNDAQQSIRPLGQNLQRGIESARSNVQSAAQSVTRSGVDTMAREGQAATQSGQSTGNGYAQGLRNSESEVRSAARYLANAANQEFQATQQIKSPSRVWRKFGRFTGQGLILGLQDEKPAVERAVAGLLGTPDMSGLNTSASAFMARTPAGAGSARDTVAKINAIENTLTRLLDVCERGGNVYLDKRTIVGEIAPGISRTIGSAAWGLA